MTGEIFALDLASGAAGWSYDTGAPLVASPSIAGQRLVIGNVDGQLFCFGEGAARAGTTGS